MNVTFNNIYREQQLNGNLGFKNGKLYMEVFVLEYGNDGHKAYTKWVPVPTLDESVEVEE